MQSQYYCKSKHSFPETVKERFRVLNKSKDQVFAEAKDVKVANVTVKTIENKKYLWGTLIFKAPLDDYDYSVDESFNLTKRNKRNDYTEKIPFILQLGGNNIIFFKKDVSDKYARKIISSVVFGNQEDINPVNFDVEGIRKNIDNGNFSDCWMNLVKCSGNINSQRQTGTNIDSDPQFLDGSDYRRSGIGIEVSLNGDTFKIAVYKGGNIVLFKAYDELDRNITLYFDLLNIFSEFHL